MATVTVHEARADLPGLIARVLGGEDVVIGQEPAMRLVPDVEAKPPERRFGSMKGQFAFDDRFFESLPEDELRRWEGHED